MFIDLYCIMNVLLSNLIRLTKCGVSSSALFYTANGIYTGASITIWNKCGLSDWLLGALAKLRKRQLAMSVCLSVCPHATTRLPLDAFSWNLVFGYFSKICRENEFSFKSDKNKGYVTWSRPIYCFGHVSLNSS